MITIDVNLTQPEFGFTAVDEAGKTITMDTSPADGGKAYGVRPMQALLMGLGGCSGIDVVSILKKKRQTLTSFKMAINGEREQGKVPSLWEKVHVVFYLSGDVGEEQAQHAVALSIDKYCSVAETLRRAGCTITWEVKVNN
ncbi:MAG: OsmC family protein [Flavipsychrobacter sp.]|nr:OsmC family protein [Flavipsychrobacter sp.]